MTVNATLLLALLSGSNLVAGFLLQWYALIYFGAGAETDALLVGATLPQVVAAVLGASLLQVLVPILSGEVGKRFANDVWSLFVSVGAAFTSLALVLYVSAPVWVPLVAPGFSDAAVSLTISLGRIQLLTMIVTGLITVQSAAYHAKQHFQWVETSNLLATLCACCILIWALPKFGVVAVAWVSVIRAVLQSLLLTREMGRFEAPDFKRSSVSEAWKRARPMLIGALYFKSDIVLDRVLLSLAPTGAITLFNLGQQVFGACSQILTRSLATPLLPVLSNFHKSGDTERFRAHFQKRHATVLMLCVLMLLVGWIVAKPALLELAAYGKISESDVDALFLILAGLAGVFLGGTAGQVTLGAFYARGDTRTPTRLGIYTFTIYLPLKAFAFLWFGIVGIAVAASLFFVANWLLQLVQINQMLKSELAVPKS